MITTIRVADACTGIRLMSKDGSPIFGRTMEFGGEMLPFSLIVVPRGHTYTGNTPDGENGMKWNVDLGFVTAVPTAMPGAAVEGINEAGLQGGGFFFDPYPKAKWQKADPENYDKTISGWQVITYILSKARTVEDVKRLLPKINVVEGVSVPDEMGWGIEPKVHYAFNDETGASIVVQYLNGELNIFDNPLGTLTNAPDFQWHQENLTQFTSLPINQVPPFELVQETEGPTGLDIGSKADLPGAMTSQNRFVRAAIFSQTALPFDDAETGVQRVLNILHNFDIPYGYKSYRHVNGDTYPQYTQWTSISDLRNRRLYFKTFANPTVQYIDLNDVDLDNDKIVTIPVSTGFTAQSVTLPNN
ncbi:linear amide C-N hydrolase [Flammeovirga sp. EKP202]|uniref:linear amide C-N hydrolase n=1 Tax=Flammeovirga sp. EKP202 TaxID=2770592 RepID=UPI001CB82BD0|nr:linear amide C-N hydrolase [Flammeovirga sp. EKP202]